MNYFFNFFYGLIFRCNLKRPNLMSHHLTIQHPLLKMLRPEVCYCFLHLKDIGFQGSLFFILKLFFMINCFNLSISLLRMGIKVVLKKGEACQ